MRSKHYKYFICRILVVFGAVLSFSLAGCTDNPEHADAKQIRRETADALETVAQGADAETLQSVRNRLQSSIVTHRQAPNEAKDAARLASGGLALARGRQLQSDLALKTLPLRNSINAFEETLRSAENLLLEKERIEGIVASGLQEMAELEQLLNGTTEKAGLKQRLADARAKLNRLQEQKKQEQAEKDETQAVLDDYQSRADDLLRKAELAKGDQKLQYEKQAYAILQNRKEYYIQAQASEDQIEILDSQIELAQARVDNLEKSVQQTQQQIEAIETSETRTALRQQLRQVEQELALRQQQLSSAAKTIQNELNAFQDEAQAVCELFEEAAGEFNEIRSRDASFAAKLQLAESYHQAALACSTAIRVQIDTAYRLDDLMMTSDAAFADLLEGELLIGRNIDPDRTEAILGLYDQAIEAYQSAFDVAARLGREAQCSVLKSQLLAVDSKMRLADTLNLPNVAETADARRQELIEKGQEYGVSFTQSETRKLVEYGIDYTPSLPVNLDVLAEQLESRFSAWKQLPLAQQEAAIEANLAAIDEFISRYGESLEQKLGPLRQEMLSARERGFEEPAAGNGVSSVSEPNSLY